MMFKYWCVLIPNKKVIKSKSNLIIPLVFPTDYPDRGAV